jgi:hypothetical protein
VFCNCYNVANHTKFYLGQLRFNVTSTGNAGCFLKSFTMVFKRLLCGQHVYREAGKIRKVVIAVGYDCP